MLQPEDALAKRPSDGEHVRHCVPYVCTDSYATASSRSSSRSSYAPRRYLRTVNGMMVSGIVFDALSAFFWLFLAIA
jgi:hypothetical protein